MQWDLFAWDYTTTNVSMMLAIISTIIIVGLAFLIAAPIGVFTGFYLVEYANRSSQFIALIRLATDTLAAIPSIVYGLFGMLFFVSYLKFQFSMLAGILTVVIMILPIIISSTEEALLSVNNSLRMGSLALGAGKLRTIFTVVLPEENKMNQQVKLKITDLDFYYGDFHALKNINMEIEENLVTAFIGPSGCGKSTFLKTLNRMQDLVPGTRVDGLIELDGQDIYAKNYDVNQLRK